MVRGTYAPGNQAIGPQRSISRIKHDLHRKNAQSAHSPAKPACGSRAQRLPRRAPCTQDRARRTCAPGNQAIGRWRSISRINPDLHRKNAQSEHSPAKPAYGSRAQRLHRRAHVPRIGRAGHTRLGTRPSDRRGRRPDILGRGTCAHDAIGTRRICARFFALAAS